MQILKIEFEDDAKFSLNKVWAGGKGSQWLRKRLADDWHYWTEKALEEQKIKPIKGKCMLFFYFSFRKNMLDSSNCAPMAKAIEDSMDRYWIMPSDTNADVVGVFYQSVNKPLSVRKDMELNTVDIIIYEENDKMFEQLVIESTPFI